MVSLYLRHQIEDWPSIPLLKNLLVVSHHVEVILLAAQQVVQGELFRAIGTSRSVPVTELWLVVERVAVHRSLVFRVLGLDLDGHRVGGLGDQCDLWWVRGSVDNELVGNLEEKVKSF